MNYSSEASEIWYRDYKDMVIINKNTAHFLVLISKYF
jgi:hypothetical protein